MIPYYLQVHYKYISIITINILYAHKQTNRSTIFCQKTGVVRQLIVGSINNGVFRNVSYNYN